MSELGRWLLVFGLVLAVSGLLLMAAGRVPWLGRLPGDIHIERNGFHFYFPLTTCLLLSALLSLVFWLIRR